MDAKRRAASGCDVEELGLGFVRLAGNMSLDIIESWAVMLDGLEGSVILGSEGGVRLQPFGFFQSAGDLDLNSTVDLERFMFRQHNVKGIGRGHAAGPCPDDADTDLFLCHPCTEAGRSMRLQSAAAGGMLAA